MWWCRTVLVPFLVVVDAVCIGSLGPVECPKGSALDIYSVTIFFFKKKKRRGGMILDLIRNMRVLIMQEESLRVWYSALAIQRINICKSMMKSCYR